MILHKKCVHRYLKGAMVATKFNEDKLYYFRNRKEKWIFINSYLLSSLYTISFLTHIT